MSIKEKFSFCYVFIVFCLFPLIFAQAQIQTDGSLGLAQKLNGPNYIIDEGLGQRAGSNLFHSFSEFNIDKGESATFRGANEISNVISRVTGGKLSTIDGLLKSEIENANFYLINSAGVLFGPNARLSIDGSFHTSTADYLRLGDADLFYSEPLQGEILSTAAPKAFGFFGAPKGGITLEGGILKISDNETLSLIGGNLQLRNSSQVIAASGQVNLVSLQSAGEVSIVDGSNDLDVSEFRAFGDIAIVDNSAADVTNSDIDSQAGRLFVRGNNLRLDKDGKLRAQNRGRGEGEGGGVDVHISGDLFIGESSVIEMGGNGNFGQISIEAENITIDGAGQNNFPGILIFQSGEIDGSENNPRIKANNTLNILNGGVINTSATHVSNAGLATIQATNLTIDGQDLGFAGIGSVADTNAAGDGGDLNIQVTEQLKIINGGTIDVSTFSKVGGSGGKVKVQAKNLLINGENAEISALSSNDTTGNSGEIDIDVGEQLQILNGGKINTSTFGIGKAGPITVRAKALMIDGQDFGFTGIGSIAGPEAIRNGGDLNILVTEQLEIIDGGLIDTSTFGTGNAGSITMQTKNLNIDGQDFGFAGIRSAADSDSNSNGGNLEITITEQFEITNGSVSAFAKTGNAGNLSITAGNDIRIKDSGLSISAGQENFNLNDLDNFQQPELRIEAGDSIHIKNSILSTDAGVLGSERGAGGDIYLSAPIEIWLENSKLLAQAGYAGGNVYIDPIRYIVISSDVIAQADVQGGNYQVVVTQPSGWIQSTDSQINLSGRQSGSVLSNTSPFDLGAELSDLNLDFLNLKEWVSQPCKFRLGGTGSSFVVTGWRGVSNNIDDFLPSEPILLSDYDFFETKPMDDNFLQEAVFPGLNDGCKDCP